MDQAKIGEWRMKTLSTVDEIRVECEESTQQEEQIVVGTVFDEFEPPRRSVPNKRSRSLWNPYVASRALTSAS